MEEKDLQKFIDVMPILNGVMQDDITTIVFDLRKEIIAAYAPGQLKMPSKVGDPIKNMENYNLVKRSKKQLSSIVPTRFFGVPAKGLLTPVFDEDGEVVAIVSVSKSIEKEAKIEEGTSKLFSSMEQLNAGVEEIASSSQHLSTFIKEMDEFSTQTEEKINEIDSIIEDIKNISKHSNLLALNASIEAARAGEAGRGFSVVAKEMGKLSSLSKDSAEKVAGSLLEIKKAIQFISGGINKTSLSSENQAAATEEMAATADEVVLIAKQLADYAKIQTVEELIRQKKI
ncbi:methyl-accepting chemotaxis protein [Desulfosporosinus lacus]|uniref:Methyl-accepting chemotaxis protein (MCP) signalling domain-containing protein n=1 Tax=Desulfosporosinus lacus DSM 15449 TaxID=1121420 RepID=A0A1M5Z6B3_9FIRM|nr:methyl-accepting chemotaxis protein [Desulfosporosinus lacus]SHI19825.1 Methyl-accepting chemotaxis protein (MCP) signalling domain-containing protein [Desulfosporosinus lacus DSM 15449]